MPHESFPAQLGDNGRERSHRYTRKRDIADPEALPPGEQILDERCT
jgi:hypothetical protein